MTADAELDWRIGTVHAGPGIMEARALASMGRYHLPLPMQIG